MLSNSVLAQGGGDVVEIGQATTTTTLSPIYTPKNYSFTQQLYTAEEIGTDGTITSIAFHWAYNGSKTFGIDVYMKHTDRAYFETTNDRIPLSTTDKVFSGTINPDHDSWVNITLDDPFEYDGSSNLVIAVHRTSGSSGFSEVDNNWNVIGTWYYTTTDRYTILYMGDDNSQYVSLSPSYMTPSTYRPNIQIEINSSATCKAPKNFAASDVTTNTATLTWTAGSEEQNNWDVYLTQTATDVPDDNTTPTYQVSECTKALTGLTAQTTYHAYVRAACSSADNSRWVSTLFTTTREALAVNAENPYQQDFETNNDWSLTNGSLTNQWCWGSATNNGGSKAMYVSNDNGTSNQYTLNSTAVVYASKLFNFDQGTYTFVFDWKGYGESTYDYLRVALVPGDMEFTAGTSLPSGVTTTALPNTWIALDGGSKLNLQNSWQTQTAEASLSGTYTMVFIWRNDNGGGSQPPTAIDNINITLLTCPRPTHLVVDAATLTWTPGDPGQNAWEISLCTTTNPETGTITTVTGNPTYTFSNLTLETQYYAYVRSDCGSEYGKSSWSDVASIYLGYCQPAPSSVDKKGITNVTFGSGDEIVNNSNYPTSSPYYGNYSNLIGAVAASETATVSITYETGYTYGTLIWIDWNSNYELEDSEIVFRGTSTSSNPTTLEASFTVPATQAEGYYRMRIGGADSYFDSFIGGNTSANHDPCSGGSYKVFHDYTLHVLPVPSCPTPTSFAASNVTATTARLSWTENGTASNWVLEYSDDANFASPIEITTDFNANGNSIFIDLKDLAAETQYYARVKSINGNDESEWASCSFITTATCIAPSGLSATKTGTTITLSWTAGAQSQDAWDIRYKKSSDGEYTYIHLDNHAATSYTITGLSPVTTYSVNVRAWCDEEDQSKWGYNANNQNQDLSVTTECGSLILPFAYGFEENLQTGTNYPMPQCWNRITYSSYSNPDAKYPYVFTATTSYPYAHGGNGENSTSGHSLYLWRNSGSSNETAILPEVDAEFNMNEIQISFWARLNNSASNQGLSIGIMNSVSSGYTEVSTVNIESDHFKQYTVSLPGYSGTGRYIAIKCGSGSDVKYYIDDITLEVIPSCLIPINLDTDEVDVNEVTLTWTPRGNETAWNIQYKKASESDWSDPIAVDETTYTLTGLQRATSYVARVQANCNADDQSEWSNPISFQTECGIWPIDTENSLSEDFSDDSFPPVCWQKVNFGGMGSTNGWLLSFNNNLDNQGAVSSDFKYETWLFLPQMHLNGDAILSFDHLFGSGDEYIPSSIMVSTTPNLDVEDILTDGFIEANFTQIWIADEDNLPSAKKNEIVSLSDYDNEDVYVAFRYEGTYNYSGKIWYIDNVRVCLTLTPSVYTKDIVGYGNGTGGYYLIASPVDGLNPSEIDGMITNPSENYDLYYFDQTQEREWINYKTGGFSLTSGMGYLYASHDSVTLTFSGTPVDVATFDIPLVKNEDANLAGWNLVGNPFTETAYLADGRDFYVMNAEGSEIVVADTNCIAPMEGIFVIAETDSETVTFTQAPPAPQKEGVTLNISKGTGDVIDRVLVHFGDGGQLRKCQLMDNSTKLYIPQDGNDYAVVNVGRDAMHYVSTEIPVNFKAKENGTYTLTISESLNSKFLILNLIDHMTGTEIDLLQTPSYTFEATVTDDASRFTLVFMAIP